MPTADRRRFVARAIRCFQQQDYPNLELVVIDDGEDAVGDLTARDPRIVYVRPDGRRSIGAKRNLACETARGEVIVHWDDDDWSADWRVSYQVAELQRARADLCGLRSLTFYDPGEQRAWRYSYPARTTRAWVAGGTLCYTKAFWSRSRFPDLRIGEDAAFVWARTAKELLVLDDERFYLAVIHPGNTSRKVTSGSHWRPQSIDEVRAIMGPNFDRFFATDSGRDDRYERSHVTVSIPYFRCRPYVAQAVESVLGQTHEDLTVIVVNDADPVSPWQSLSHIDDPRLVRFDLAANGGRYLADAIVLAATDAPYFVVQDADDWSDHRRIESLLRAVRRDHAIGAVSAALCHRTEPPVGSPVVQRYPRIGEALTSRLEHRANHHGLFQSAALRLIGVHGGFRIGYDTFLVNLLSMIGNLSYVDEPLYHRRLRPGSLTTAPSTGMRSPTRRAVHAQLRDMYAAAFADYGRYLAGDIGPDDLATAIAGKAARHRDPVEAVLIAAEQARLRRAIDGQAPAAKPSPRKRSVAVAGTRGRSADAYEILDDRCVSWNLWTIGRTTAIELVERLEQRRPRRILELGSGLSTAILASWAADRGARIVTLEHDPTYHARTGALLERFGVAAPVDLRLAPLGAHCCPDGRSYPWYDSSLQGEFDFVLVDGPPRKVGRQAALFAISEYCSADWELWLNDGRRDHERECLALWQHSLDFSATFRDLDGKGQWLLGPAERGTCGVLREMSAGLGVTIATGGRPHLLRETVEALRASAPALLRDAYVLVLVNAPDPATESYAEELEEVDRVVRHRGPPLSKGVAISRLMAELQEVPTDHVLHLEDAWSVCTLDTSWLERARRVLIDCPEVGQVRLRHRAEPVPADHSITGRRIEWSTRPGFEFSSSAHFTFDPSMLRTRDLEGLFPCRDEADAQRRFLHAGFATAQLSPGVFRHTGGEQRAHQRDTRRSRLQAGSVNGPSTVGPSGP